MSVWYKSTWKVISLALFLLGMIFILSATKWGRKRGTQAIVQNGGSIETSKYYLIIEESAKDYRYAGVVMCLIGGFGMIYLENGERQRK